MCKWGRKTTIITNAVGIVIVVMILSGCAGIQQALSHKNAGNPNSNNGVTTTEVKKGNIKTIISGSCSFIPVKLTSLSLDDISGPLRKLYVKTNAEIKAGDPVAEIDPQKIIKQIANQNMTMQLWEIRKLQNKENLAMSARNLKIAEIDLKRATELNKERPTEENAQELIKQKILYDQAVSENKNTKWSNDLANIQCKLDESTLNDLKTKLADSTLKSPIDGIVTFVENLSEAETVSSGRVIARIAERQNIVLQMLVMDSRYIQNVKNGVLKVGSTKYDVELYSPQPGDQLNQVSSDSKTNNRIYIKFGETMPEITWENIGNAALELKKTDVLIVPKAALREVNGKTVVDVYKGNLEDTVDVVRGLEEDGNVEIISGLEAGQTVVLH